MPRGTVALGSASHGSQAGLARVPGQLGILASSQNTVGVAVLEHGGDSMKWFQGFGQEGAHCMEPSTAARIGHRGLTTVARCGGRGSRLRVQGASGR
jgi:hypothetical protein